MRLGSAAFLNILESQNYRDKEVVYDGHLSQSKFKKALVKGSLTAMRNPWHI